MKHPQHYVRQSLLTLIFFTSTLLVFAQPVLETGKNMPNEWVDKDTHHKVIKLTRKEGSNYSFYFHNNPFVGNKMVFYNTSPQKPEEQAAKLVDRLLEEKVLWRSAADKSVQLLVHAWPSGLRYVLRVRPTLKFGSQFTYKGV